MKQLGGKIWQCILVVLLSSGCGQQNSSPHSESLVGSTNPASKASKAYQLTYLVPAGNMISEQRQCSDGAGRLRIEVGGISSVPLMINVYDMNRNQVTSWTDGTDRFTRRPLGTGEQQIFATTPPAGKGTESLGEKEIDGHPCHGWRFVSPNGLQSEMWVDDVYGCMVKTIRGGATIEIEKFSNEPPSASLFDPPAGYKDETAGPGH